MLNRKYFPVLFVVLMIFLFGFVHPSQAENGPGGAGKLGVGFLAGSPTGLTLKYFVDRKNTIEAGLGVDGDVTGTLDYVRTDFSAFSLRNPAENGKLAFDIGVGARVRGGDDDIFGVRGIVGLSYFFPKNPFELFVEIVPTIVLENNPDTDIDGGLGFRYYFP